MKMIHHLTYSILLVRRLSCGYPLPIGMFVCVRIKKAVRTPSACFKTASKRYTLRLPKEPGPSTVMPALEGIFSHYHKNIQKPNWSLLPRGILSDPLTRAYCRARCSCSCSVISPCRSFFDSRSWSASLISAQAYMLLKGCRNVSDRKQRPLAL